jgi:hypothetical protein
MKTDYTVVGRIRNHENVEKLVNGIERKGYTCYNFLKTPATPDTPGLPWEEQVIQLESHPDFWNDQIHHDLFRVDMEGLKNADTFVLLLPAGKAAHMEAGVAYGLGKKLILVGEVESPETLYLMFNEHYSDIDSFLRSI